MIAALLAINSRRPAKLAHPDDQRRVQQAALIQVFQQGCPGGVEHLAQLLDLLEVLSVRVPGVAARRGVVERHFDEWHAALHQSAGQKATLAEQIAAVAVAELGIFFIQVKCLGR